MTYLDMVKDLIDKATKVCRTKAELARRIDVYPVHINQWIKGTRTCQPHDIAAMAAVAGLNATEYLARATIEMHAGTKKGELLQQSLGKHWLATGDNFQVKNAGFTPSSVKFKFFLC